MQDNLEYIDRYFQGTPLPEESKEFEKRIGEDPVFAEEVALYLSVRQVAKNQVNETKKTRFKEIYAQNITNERQRPVRKLWPYMAAAAMLAGIILCWFLFIRPDSPQYLAEKYITDNFQTLNVQMGTVEDERQKGLKLFNEGHLKEALLQFEKILNLDSTDYEAKKYAGISALRLQQYDKALHYFNLLEIQPNLNSNPGAFLQATTLLKRNLPGDKQTARILLEKVVKNDLEGKEIAEQWLKKW